MILNKIIIKNDKLIKEYQKMKKIFIIFTLFYLLGCPLNAQKGKIFGNDYPINRLNEFLINKSQWKPFPRCTDRSAWEKLPSKMRETYIHEAEKQINSGWENPPASLFLDFFRTGNRSRYETASFDRRTRLAGLVLAECMEGKKRFLDDIINGIWSICEETYWGLPAHINLQTKQNSLPDIKEPTVDLFAAETGMLIAWTYYLMYNELKTVDSLITERMQDELDRRIITPNESRTDFWWMGFDNNKLNNWTPWICSNWLAVLLLVENDNERRTRNVHKIMECLDNYVSSQTEDGGCDEGPSYWNRAPASLFDCIELLQSASNGKINLSGIPIIRNMGNYIMKVFIDSNYFINFADSPHKLNPNPSLIFRYGKFIKDEQMMRFGSYLLKSQSLDKTMYIQENFGALGRIIPAIFNFEELLKYPSEKPLFFDFYFPIRQIAGARSLPNSAKGFYFAAQGGNNAESHNHNDIGNFIIYYDGKPVLIDVGPEQYTAKTFSSRRYDIWTMQSAFHNLPTINGFMQKDGEKYMAENVTFTHDDKKAEFNLDLSKAYPEEAFIKKWNRKIILYRNRGINLIEDYLLGMVKDTLKLNFMTCIEPKPGKQGLIYLGESENNTQKIYMEFDSRKFNSEIETITTEDPNLLKEWGNKIYRIKLKSKNLTVKDEVLIKFQTGN
jgi:hypothetical protein